MPRLLAVAFVAVLFLAAGCGPEQSGPDLSRFAAVAPAGAGNPAGTADPAATTAPAPAISQAGRPAVGR